MATERARFNTALNAQQSLRAEQIKSQLQKIEAQNRQLLELQLRQEQYQNYIKMLRTQVFNMNNILTEVSNFQDAIAKYCSLKVFKDYLPIIEKSINEFNELNDKDYTQKILILYQTTYTKTSNELSNDKKEYADSIIDTLRKFENDKKSSELELKSFKKQLDELSGSKPLFYLLGASVVAAYFIYQYLNNPASDKDSLEIIIPGIIWLAICIYSVTFLKNLPNQKRNLTSIISEMEKKLEAIEQSEKVFYQDKWHPFIEDHLEYVKFSELASNLNNG